MGVTEQIGQVMSTSNLNPHHIHTYTHHVRYCFVIGQFFFTPEKSVRPMIAIFTSKYLKHFFSQVLS